MSTSLSDSKHKASEKGKLYVVATPIGNLGDVTYRAVDLLKKVGLILAEDTRYSQRLLNEYDISNEIRSYRDQNHDRVVESVIKTLSLGVDIALISDSGTPLISDPGYRLVHRLREEDFEVISIPGPSAVTAALSVCGLPTDKFSFLGFLPKSNGKRKKILVQYGSLDSTLVIYESPYRMKKLFEQLKELFPDRKCAVMKDMTKMYQDSYYGNVEEVAEAIQEIENIKGEYVVLIEKGAN
jgi:16S rRNA (cytidine1402-2'-O)-methyltransferase